MVTKPIRPDGARRWRVVCGTESPGRHHSGIDGGALTALLSPRSPPLVVSAAVSEGRAFRTRTAPPPFGGGAVLITQLTAMR